MLQPAVKEQIIELWETGNYTVSTLAEKFEITRGQVAGIIKRAGAFRTEKPREDKKHIDRKKKSISKKAPGGLWEERLLTEPWAEYHARKRQERQEACNAVDR